MRDPLLAPADRLRLLHTYVTATEADGGLGIAPPQWDRVESVMVLHDRLFNDTWIKTWMTRQLGIGLGLVDVEKIKGQVRACLLLFLLWFLFVLLFFCVCLFYEPF